MTMTIKPQIADARNDQFGISRRACPNSAHSVISMLINDKAHLAPHDKGAHCNEFE